MNPLIFEVFLINLAAVGFVYVFARKAVLADKRQKQVLLMCFLLSPVVLAMKGIISALYVADIFAVVLFWYALRLYPGMPRPHKKIVIWLSVILILLPTFGTIVNYAFYGHDSSQFKERNMQWLTVWMFRNFIYVAIFVIASCRPVGLDIFISQLKFILMLSVGTILIGFVDYSGVRDYSIYELIMAYNTPDSSYHYTKTTLGWGFLGMFRGSVGQLYANLFCLCIPFIVVSKWRWQAFSLVMAGGCLLLVACSLSRAGMIGVVLSCILMLAFSGVRSLKLVIVIGLFSLILLPLLQTDIFVDRVNSISTYAESDEHNRVDGWLTALEAFSRDFMLLSFGNGAANREGVAAVMGAYGAHNEYIDVIFRSGFVCLVGLLITLLRLLNTMMEKRRRSVDAKEKIWLSVVPAILLTNIVIGVTQDHLFREYSGYAGGLIMYYIYGLGIAVQPTQYFKKA